MVRVSDEAILVAISSGEPDEPQPVFDAVERDLMDFLIYQTNQFGE